MRGTKLRSAPADIKSLIFLFTPNRAVFEERDRKLFDLNPIINPVC